MKLGEVVVNSYLCVQKLHQVSLNSNVNQKKILMTHLTDSPFLKGIR